MSTKAISLKYNLSGEIEEFLEEEDMTCEHTKTGLVELVSQLSTYKEEGKSLFPEVYIIDEMPIIRQSLINSEFVKIGGGERSNKLILKAVKKCAPLTFSGWAIYILRTGVNFEYGLFRSGSTIISIPASKSLLDENEDAHIILIRQVAEKIVEVKGAKGNTLIINFGVKSTSDLSPLDAQNAFIEKIIETTEESYHDQLKIFFSKLFLYVLQNGHGSLCLILNRSKAFPKYLKDGIVLDEKISVVDRIIELEREKNGSSGINSVDANAKLNGVFNIIVGMLMSDGITVFGNDSSVRAYNIFLKHPVDNEEIKNVEGGARSRTFAVMKLKLSNVIPAIYIQSQDGKTQTETI